MADEWLGRAINDYLTERGIKQIFFYHKKQGYRKIRYVVR